MNDLIKISSGGIGGAVVQTVNARDLHAFLRSGTEFTDWVKRRITEFGFTQGVDFVTSILSVDEGGDGRTQYHLTLDMAKELSMVERNEQGKRARQYFIECERRAATSPVNLNDPAFLRTALLQYTERVMKLEQTVAEQAPAVEFAHAIRDTRDAIAIGDMARVLGIGRNRMYQRLRADHILMHDNRPYQHYLDRGYFRVVESVWVDAAKEPHPTFKTLVTGRGQVYLQRKYGSEAA